MGSLIEDELKRRGLVKEDPSIAQNIKTNIKKITKGIKQRDMRIDAARRQKKLQLLRQLKADTKKLQIDKDIKKQRIKLSNTKSFLRKKKRNKNLKRFNNVLGF